jgi:hypothetical protein
MEIIMHEEWRIVPSVPDILASSLGRILVAPCQRSMPNGGRRNYTPKPTFGYEEKSATGRPGVSKRRIIQVGRLKKTFKIAQLVCEAFHGPKPFCRAVTIHLDEDPSNNTPENLKWGTQKENLNMPKYKEWQKTIRIGENSPR